MSEQRGALPSNGTHPNTSAPTAQPPNSSSACNEVNPFHYDYAASSGFLQVVKMIIVGITLFPIRVVLFFTSLVLAWFVSLLMNVGKSEEDLQKVPTRRPVLRFLFRCCARLMLFAMGFWWIRRNGVEHITVRRSRRRSIQQQDPNNTTRVDVSAESDKEEFDDFTAPILIGNHAALIDVVYLAAYHDFMAVGKVELLETPFMGRICKALQYIAVKRESAESRKEVSHEIKRRAQESATGVAKWPTLVIFPEATCTNGRSLIQFKLGAFVPCVPLQPMVLKYPYEHLMLDWVGPSRLHELLFKSMLQVYNSMTVTYLPQYFPSDDEKKKIPLFAQNVRETMAAAMGVPMTDHTFEDVQLLNEADVLQVPFANSLNVAMGTAEHQNFGIHRAREKLREFARLDKDGDGFLSREEFGAFLRLQRGPEEGASNNTNNNDAVTLEDQQAKEDARIALRDAIFDRWVANAAAKRSTGGEVVTERRDVIDFASFLACTASSKIRLRLRRRRHTAVTVTNTPSDTNILLPHSQAIDHGSVPVIAAHPVHVGTKVGDAPRDDDLGSQRSFFAEEAQDDDLLYCMTLCFGSFDRDHDGLISREEFRAGMLLVCPALEGGDEDDEGEGSGNVTPRPTTGGWLQSTTDEPDAGAGALALPKPKLPVKTKNREIDAMFEQADSNKDGTLNIDEFVSFATVHPVFLHHLLSTFESHDLLEY